MTINLSDNNPRANYTATSGQTAFTIPFDYFDDGDISVYQNGTLKTITTHYTISGSTVTLVTGATAGDKIAITRDVPLERTTDLTSTYNAASINNQLDTIVAQIADLDDRVSRSISLNDYEVGVSLDLPATADRLGKTIQFNSSTGALEVGPSGDELTSIASIASEITALDGISSNITSVAGYLTEINNVGDNIASVTSVSGSISSVGTVSTNIADVNLVAGSITDLNDVADSLDQVELVATSISNVDIVGPAIANVNTVAGDITNINTLANSTSNIALVAAALSNINTTVTNLANINLVGNNIDDVNDVANVITKVTTVADNIANVNTVAPAVTYVSTLANNISNINLLAPISTDITAAAAVASDIGDAATNAAAAISAKTAAESARDATLAAFDSFDDRYLGAKAADPSVDNDGNALVGGALYYNTTDEVMKVYTGSVWVAAYASLSGALLVANNLSDLANAASARTNLGLGTAATTASTDYATTAQGATADAALPKAGGTMTGDLTVPNVIVSGNVTGNVTGDLTGNVTGNLTGDTIGTHTGAVNATNITVTGVVTGNVTGDILGDIKADNGTVILDSGTNGRNAQFTGDVDISAIAATISDTAVDIFVYDTRKDSDGGAWRKRTQHTSWYNETLNTATRGSRKEFPAVAVIVAESNQVTIYDGDDPDLPMWMVFNATNNSVVRNGGNVSSVIFKNGLLTVGQLNGYGTSYGDFIADTTKHYGAGGFAYSYPTELSSRNVAHTYGSFDTSKTLVNSNVNDVAMTVLPNAPIDAATGLPVPTIAVATDGGVSVIKDDGTVVDSAVTQSIHAVNFTTDYLLFSTDADTRGSLYGVYISELTADGWGGSNGYNSTLGYTGNGGNSSIPSWKTLSFTDTTQTSGTNKEVAFNGSGALQKITLNGNAPSAALLAQITSDYNTGWMNGDIKLATLSDTDDTNVTGSELVTNGTFDTDISGWTAGSSASLTHSTDKLVVTNNGVAYGYAYQQITGLIVGETYTLSWGEVASNPNADISVGTFAPHTNLVTLTSAVNAGAETFIATATSATIRLWCYSPVTTASAYFDNISVRLAEEDRSVNGKGLQVFGTVQKEAVVTGADLVQYNGFNGSNYLQQPYNSDLDFGSSDDFCVMGWFKATNTTQILMSKSPASSIVSPYFEIQVDPTNVVWVGNNTTGKMITPSSIGTWNFVVVSRINGTNRLFLNGELKATASSTEDYTHSNADTLRFGTRQDGYGGGYPAGLALWRISATAPSPAQIAKIYEDEKVLFQEGAQATLYGSSDAVTALAYDDSTELLHVGTSAGRSVFQGLRRVDNTTTAVGAAISASNGLVADE